MNYTDTIEKQRSDITALLEELAGKIGSFIEKIEFSEVEGEPIVCGETENEEPIFAPGSEYRRVDGVSVWFGDYEKIDWSGDAGDLFADLEDLLNENYGIPFIDDVKGDLD